MASSALALANRHCASRDESSRSWCHSSSAGAASFLFLKRPRTPPPSPPLFPPEAATGSRRAWFCEVIAYVRVGDRAQAGIRPLALLPTLESCSAPRGGERPGESAQAEGGGGLGFGSGAERHRRFSLEGSASASSSKTCCEGVILEAEWERWRATGCELESEDDNGVALGEEDPRVKEETPLRHRSRRALRRRGEGERAPVPIFMFRGI